MKTTFTKEEANSLRLFEKLGVQRTTTSEEILKAYRAIIVKEKANKDEARLTELNVAKDVLTDDAARAAYTKALEHYNSNDGMGNNDGTGIEEVTGLEEVSELVKHTPLKRRNSRSRVIYGLIVFALVAVIGAVVYFVLTGTKSTIAEPEVSIAEPEAFPCVTSGPHRCKCGNVEFPLLIDGESVQLLTKTFNPEEIERLKTLTEGMRDTTYTIFEQLDRETRNCELTVE